MSDVVRHRLLPMALIGLFCSSALLSGCFGEYSCTEIGCSGNTECNAKTGKCEELVRSCQQTGCPTGRVCDETTGVCRPEGARCVDDSCPDRQVCNAQTGFCEARSDCKIDPCASAAEQCDTLTGQCVPRRCAGDVDCPLAFYCAGSGECRAGCRVAEEGGCPENQFCRASVGEAIGQCREECQADEDCPLGQLCEQTREGSSCELEPRCESDDDCRAAGVCYENQCQPPPCTADADCAADEVCDQSTGICVGGSCEEDIHGPNQAVTSAADLDPGSYSELMLCPGKSDWFSVHMRSADAFEFRLEHSSTADLDIFVRDAQGYLLASNQQTGPVSTLQLVSERTQDVTVQITSVGMQAETYDLHIERNPEDAFCRDDTSEENDHPGQAVVLPTDTGAPYEASLSICGADQDWFVLPNLAKNQGLSVTRVEASPGLVVDLYAPDHEIFELHQSEDDDEIRIQRLGADGDYLLRVRSWWSRSGPYRLRTQVLETFACPQAHAYSSVETAVQVPMNAVQLYAFCPAEQAWEVDWLELASPPQDGTVTAQIVAVGDLPELDVVLFEEVNGGVQPVRSAAKTDNYYQIRAPIEAGRRYLIRVSADGAPGRIVDGVNYQAFYRYESSD